MKIRASFLTLMAGALLTISGLGLNAQSFAASGTNTGTKITHSYASTVISHSSTDGNDPWPGP